ncbi:hypothetical protein [Natronospora cellulosivora (SeqCode)]
MSYRKGWTVFFLEPGKYDNKKCRVCDSECEVERNKERYSASIEAMTDRASSWDIFKCPNVEESWHIKLESLVLDKDSLTSNKISKLLQKEIDELKLNNLR